MTLLVYKESYTISVPHYPVSKHALTKIITFTLSNRASVSRPLRPAPVPPPPGRRLSAPPRLGPPAITSGLPARAPHHTICASAGRCRWQPGLRAARPATRPLAAHNPRRRRRRRPGPAGPAHADTPWSASGAAAMAARRRRPVQPPELISQ